jgi:hypothetical protein
MVQKWHTPNSLRGLNVSPKLKTMEGKESEHAHWLTTL